MMTPVKRYWIPPSALTEIEIFKAEDVRTAVTAVIAEASRCMCPYVPGVLDHTWKDGALAPGWKPDLSLGVNGKHKQYCPFGIQQRLMKLLRP